jgi:LuxR family maltose regulon positive regulatory protein
MIPADGDEMVEMPTTGPERALLLATKMAVPRLRPGRIDRPRLLAQLQAASARELVLISAPAGFGKSTLLADWVRRDPRAVAWLSLDEGDNDPVRFWRHVAAALDATRPGLAVDLVGPDTTSVLAVVTMLVNELAEATEDLLLVVDDYHVIHAPEVHRSVEFLVEHLPTTLRLVVAGRSDPPLPLARLRARGQLAEVRAADLRFTFGETAQLLGAATGQELAPQLVAALGERTEGWAAGLQLAALSLRGRTDVRGFVAEFSGSHRFVLDYLTEEVLDRQAPEVRTFLLKTSVLERLSGSLCDAVLGSRDSQRLLEAIERDNLFLLPLDGERRWWRYHHLFADLLRARLSVEDPDRLPELHRAAADWYERHGLPDDAIRHALAAGDADAAAAIVETYLEEQLLRRTEGATLTRWLTALPRAVLLRRPRLVLGEAIVGVLSGVLDEVEALLAVVERTGPGPPYRPSIERRVSILSNVAACTALCRADLARARGDAVREVEQARAALARADEADALLRAMARYHLAETDWLAGRLAEAEEEMTALLAEWSTSDQWLVLQRVGFDLGLVQHARGRLDAALRTYRSLGARADAAASALAGMSLVGVARVLFERDELVEAAALAAAGVERCRRLAYAPPLVNGLTVLARIRMAIGDPEGALAVLEEAESVMPGTGDRRLLLGTRRAELAIARGEPAEAAAWVRARDLRADDPPSYARHGEYRVLARVLIAGGDPDAAVALLERWRALATARDAGALVIAVQALMALAHAARGDEPAALGALEEALTLAAPEGWVRVFVGEGAPLAALLRSLMSGRRLDDVPRAYLARLAAAFARQGTPVLAETRTGEVAVAGLIEPLSPREREVLALVALGRSNRGIGAELYIGLDTVKRHVSHIFAKLGVTNRTEAVARARALGLLD